ncbi:MAG: hypothetical protein HY200_02225 [Nitrospirae bacterium]|nr:hypothetical protein [Nitrospirota bacterium]MBI3593752.1 hypothetical protein [Nitrospirota bacterium]
MNKISGNFLKAGLMYVVLGMFLGIGMAARHNHRMMPVHAHLNLVGWVSMALFAMFYQVVPKADSMGLAKIHFWIANLGLLILAPSIALVLSGIPEGEIGAIAGSLITLGSFLLFIFIVFKTTTPTT